MSLRVVYTVEHWEILNELRRRAIRVMEELHPRFELLVIGSVARGDIHRNSDVDLVSTRPYPPGILEEELEIRGFHVIHREIVQATPLTTPRIYFYMGDNVKVSTPITPLKPLEEEFYRFAGYLTLSELKRGERRPGVNKRLMLIIPTADGHEEQSIVNREAEAAKILGVSISIVRERVEKLLERREAGRRGLYLRAPIPPWMSVEEYLDVLRRRPSPGRL